MKPLTGVKIVDFTQAHAGSAATMLLSDFGAEVIKIERKGVGDLARYWEPIENGQSGYYVYLNRGKKSVSINASTPEGREILFRLIKEADVVCENFKYGSMERMGLSYETIKKVNPSIIYASLNGFGQYGIMKNAIGLDLQLQAMSGMMDRTGFAEGTPVKAGAALGDHVSGLYLALAINLALIHRKATGEGQMIDIAILDALFSILESAQVCSDMTGSVPERSGNGVPFFAPYDAYATKDGYVVIGVLTQKQWEKLCHALKAEHLLEKYPNDTVRWEKAQELKTDLEQILQEKTKIQAEALLNEADVVAGAVRTPKEAMVFTPIVERNMVATVQDERLGTIQMPGTVIKMDKTPGGFTKSAPTLGEHTKYYLQQIGYSEAEIQNLLERGIVEGRV